MVSIHRVLVDVLLIISVVCFMFRFKRGTLLLLILCNEVPARPFPIRISNERPRRYEMPPNGAIQQGMLCGGIYISQGRLLPSCFG